MLERALTSATGLILLYLAWAWGGLQPAWLIPAVWACAILLGGVLYCGITCRGASASGGVSWWRDVFFYAGLMFLLYLTVQWWNAGRSLFFDVGLGEWRCSPPRHRGWPSSFSRAESVQALTWFFPCWVLGLAVRSPALGSRGLYALLRALVYGAGLLSLLGVVQFAAHAKARYWIRPAKDAFFASFGYVNHAAAFFVLMGALAAGLLFRAAFRARAVEGSASGSAARRHTLRIAALAASLVLCLVGANLSLSRAGVILAWSLAAFVAAYGLVRGWGKFNPVARVNLVAATLATLCVFYFAVAGFGSSDIRKQFAVRKPVHHRVFPVLDNINLTLGGRPEQASAAVRMWRDNAAFGVGAWGYRHLLALYIPEDMWGKLVRTSGRANVHCDPLQFLVEFGAVGTAIMLTGLLALIAPLFRAGEGGHAGRAAGCRPGSQAEGRPYAVANHRNPVMIMGMVGVSLVVFFSLIDLPFRCPAILCTWVVVLAAMKKLKLDD
jgi:hypothetical protein